MRPGLSTGEGVRFALEYGHRNLGGDAIALSLRIQLSYLPDFLILDPQVRENYDRAFGYPAFDKRIATRSTVTLAFPDIGLGPLVRAAIDGVFVRDLERDFALTKEAGIVEPLLPSVPAAAVLDRAGCRVQQRPHLRRRHGHPVPRAAGAVGAGA